MGGNDNSKLSNSFRFNFGIFALSGSVSVYLVKKSESKSCYINSRFVFPEIGFTGYISAEHKPPKSGMAHFFK